VDLQIIFLLNILTIGELLGTNYI